MIELMLLLLAAAAGCGLAGLLRLPVIPVLLVTGFVLPYLGFSFERDDLNNAVILGLTFLAFAMGIELNPKRAGRQRRAVWIVAVVQFLGLGTGGFLLARLMGFEATSAVYLALALCASSTLVVVRHLKRRQQMFEPFGRLVNGVLLLQDVFVIVLIVVLLGLPGGAEAVLRGIGGTVLLFGLAYVCLKWVMPYLIIELKLEEEALLLLTLTALFCFMGLAHLLELPLVVGAFLAGVSLSSFPVNGVVRGLINSLADFFLAIFFIVVGMILTVPEGHALFQAIVFAVFVVVLTPPLVAYVGERTGLSYRASLESGLLLAQTSEFSLLVGIYGVVLGQIPEETFAIIAMFTVMTMMITPFVGTDGVAQALMRLRPTRARIRGEMEEPEDHILVLGYGSNGHRIVKPLREAGHRVLVVDDDPGWIRNLHNEGIPCIRGDACNEELLRKAGAREAKFIISSLRRVSDSEVVLRYVRVSRVPVFVRVFEPGEAERIKRLGGTPLVTSEAAAEQFESWFRGTIAGGNPSR
jgi:monovalent cation:H+ antiporter-2, CPA2 family